MAEYNKAQLTEMIVGKLLRNFGRTVDEATPNHMFKACAMVLRDIMAEAAVYGTPTVKRIYGDWTTPNMASWKPLLLEHAITPIQQYSYTTGKHATDWPPVSGRPV